MNLPSNFNYQIIHLNPDYEGETIATFISSKFNTGNRRSLLYLHGFIDYFFHPHVCDQFIKNKFDFYALDMRKYGRSILEHQHPNYCKDITEYFEEIDITILHIYKKSNRPIYLLGHSTGGLIASYYMNYGKEKNLIKGLILNSPFLDFVQNNFEKTIVCFFAQIISKIFPYSKIPKAIPAAYVQSIHKSFFGEWEFNLDWKPVNGFPIYFKWILAIKKAQKRVLNSNLQVPILVMYSSHSIKMSIFSNESLSSDIILDVKDIKKFGGRLGKHVTMVSIENALHDIFLSSKDVRLKAFKKMFHWLKTLENEK